MSDILAINTKWSVLDFHSHLEIRADEGQHIRIEDIDELIELMDWLEKKFGHVRQKDDHRGAGRSE